jgi:hypothetical protein
MVKAGILVHARHLETIGWDDLMWGKPDEDSLGSLPMAIEILLREPACEPFTCIVIGRGPSSKDGMNESEYIRHYLLMRLPELKHVPRFKKHLKGDLFYTFAERLLGMIHVTEQAFDTRGEIAAAAGIFAKHGVTKVVQVAAVNHAPRCVRSQSDARANGLIPAGQLWSLVADDRPFAGETPLSTTIFEPPHRGDDPLLGFQPKMTEVFKPYQYNLPPERKKELIRLIDAFMRKHARPD